MDKRSEDIVPLNQVRENIHFALLQEALSGVEDVRDGLVATARQVLAKYEDRRKR